MDHSKRARQEPKTYIQKMLPKRARTESTNALPKKNAAGNALVLDNGGYTIKVGYSRHEKSMILPNHIMKAKSERKRCFIADQVEDCRDLSGLFYIMPHEHGYLSKFDVQKTIWDYTFHKFPIDEHPVVMTQPILNFRSVQDYMDEIFFEEYDVKSLYRANATDFSRFQYLMDHNKDLNTSCVVIDSGYSNTHIVPYINGKKYLKGIVRLDIGGKLLTNYLKDILSYRQLHVMEETYVINQVKEDTCFMSEDFKRDMKIARTTDDIVKTYVLPDFHHVRRGYVQSDINNQLAENCQILKLNNERISVPEVLMRPSIIPGMDQAGLVQSIAHAISKCPERYRYTMAGNIILTGGNCMFPGFQKRIEIDTRVLLPCNHKLSIYQSENAIDYAWQGGKSLSKHPSFKSLCVTKQTYEESGSNYIYRKFNEYSKVDDEKPKPVEEVPFSYLDYWKKEGVDIFGKDQMRHDASKNDIEFILEGEGIEEYDGKYVTIEFEFNDEEQKVVEPIPVKVEKPIIPVAPIQVPPQMSIHVPPQIPTHVPAQSSIHILPQIPSKVPQQIPIHVASQAPLQLIGSQPIRTIKKKRVSLLRANQTKLQPAAPLLNTIKQSFIKHPQTKQDPETTMATKKFVSLLKDNKPLTVVKPPLRSYKPVFSHQKVVEQPPRVGPQLLTLGTNVTLNGSSFIVSNPAGTKTVSLLNNAVIVPPNVITKNVTLQLIPFRPDLMRPKTTNYLITKPQ